MKTTTVHRTTIRIRLLLLLAIAMFCSVATAGPIDKQSAQQIGRKFLNDVRMRPGKQLRLVKQASRSDAPAGDKAYYYVFNVDADKGFVIVGGDDNADEIIGYSDTGSIDPDNIPENMQAWLNGYVENMKLIEKYGVKEKPAQRKASRRAGARQTVSPLLTSKWNQRRPYNLKSPGRVCVTGCVATAMAQVMYYTEKEAIYTTSVKIPSDESDTMMDDDGNTILDFTKMKDTYTGEELLSDPSADAVATLMRCCGISVDMDYDTNVSSASFGKIISALLNDYGYDNTIKAESRTSYTEEGWEELIYNELVNQRPVFLSAQTGAWSGGHAFVVDGFDGELFHINWGWGGYGDGFFVLSYPNPFNGDGSGISIIGNSAYSYDMEAIIGVSKNGNEAPAEPATLTTKYMLCEATTTTRASESENFDTPIYFSSFYNLTNITNTFDFGLGVFDDEDNLVTLLLKGCCFLEPDHYVAIDYWDRYVNFGKGLTDGTYYIYSISRVSGETEWQKCKGSNRWYVKAVVTGNSATLISPHTSADILTCSGMTITGSMNSNELLTLNFTIINNGTTAFSDYLYLEFGEITSSKYFEIDAGATKTFSIDCITESYGPEIPISLNNSNYNLYTGTVNIASGYRNNVKLTLEATAVLKDDTHCYGNPLNVKVTAYNNTDTKYHGTVGAILSVEAAEGWWSTYTYTLHYGAVTVGPHDKIEFMLSFEFDNYHLSSEALEAWLTRPFKIEGYYSHPDGDFSNGYLPSCFLSGGDGIYRTLVTDYYVTYDGNGNKTFYASDASITVPEDAVVLDLRGNTTVTEVTPNSNPNCLYLLEADATVPNGITTNIVKGNKAEHITLSDGYDFYTPIYVKAADVSYTRTFTRTSSGGTSGWNSLILPFDVASVTIDGNVKDFFHSNNDIKGQFWVKAFCGDNASQVTFEHAAAIKANTPYIIGVPNELAGKAMNFHGKNCILMAETAEEVLGSNYSFTGTTAKQTAESYTLDDAGRLFEAGTTSIAPFRAYFTANDGKPSGTLSIVGDKGITDISQLDDAIYIEPVAASINSDVTIDVCLKNHLTASVYSFDMVLPEGVTIAINEHSRYFDELTERHTGHSRRLKVWSNGVCNMATLAGRGEELTGNDGAIRHVTLRLADNMSAGLYEIKIKNASYTLADGTTVPMNNVKSTISILQRGDVNDNGVLEFADAMGIANHVVGIASEPYIDIAADMNKNGKTDIGDAVGVLGNFSHLKEGASIARRSISSSPSAVGKKQKTPASDSDIIQFADAKVKEICVLKWDTDGDGELSMSEAAAVTRIGHYDFCYYDEETETETDYHPFITSFDELQYFTRLTDIGRWTFKDCSNLVSITLPNSLIYIEQSAFQYCSSLKSIIIPNSVRLIDWDAFSNCYSLTSITIPYSVTSLGSGAFNSCFNLTSVTVEWETPLETSAFNYYLLSEMTLYVPLGTKERYAAADTWGEFGKIEEYQYIAVTDISKRDDAIYMRPAEANAGDEVTVDICLKNQTEAAAYSFNLVLPEGITIASDGEGLYEDELAERHADDDIRLLNNRGDGVYSFAALSPTPKEMPDNDGVIRRIKLHVAKNMASSLYAIMIEKAAYALLDGTLVEMDDVKTKIDVQGGCLPGDVNGDGQMSITDAVAIVNFIFGNAPDGFNEVAADVNGDGMVTITDAVAIMLSIGY